MIKPGTRRQYLPQDPRAQKAGGAVNAAADPAGNRAQRRAAARARRTKRQAAPS